MFYNNFQGETEATKRRQERKAQDPKRRKKEVAPPPDAYNQEQHICSV